MSQKALRTEVPALSGNQSDQRLQKARSLKSENLEDAIQLYEDIVEEYPNKLEASLELALLYIDNENYGNAYRHLKTTVRLKPDSGDLWYLLAKSLYKLYRCEAALIAYERAEALGFSSVRMFNEKAMCLSELNRFDEALDVTIQNLKVNPDALSAMQAKATMHEIRGEPDEAIHYYKKILESLPGEPVVLYRLSDMGALSEQNLEYCNPSHEIHKRRKMTWIEYSYLEFAAAIQYNRQKEYDEAFQHFSKANGKIRAEHDFNRENLTLRTDLHIEFFTKKFLDNYPSTPNDDVQPIFIIGMPRSGTTLIEQILSSHSRVAAGGEITYVSRIENSLVQVSAEKNTSYPQNLSELTPQSINDFSQQYIAYVNKCFPQNVDFITDKMPPNFMNLGLIHMIFPKAKFIHARRNPVDTCLSCYFKRFNDLIHLSFTFDLEDLGFYYNEYRRLMAHWKSVLSPHILDIHYEDLLDNQEELTRRMLDFIDLGWEDQCMKFYENERGVRTASLHQVRKPIYKSASGRWKRYENHLTPLITELKKGEHLLP